MKYVKHFDIDGVETRQVACIELHGKPNAATEGHVGVLGIDMDSPLHDVYKCVAVNGSIYTWDLLSSGLSIMSATVSGGGAETARFEYAKLKKPSAYVIKVGDLILDSEGHLYQIDGLNVNYCDASYCGTRVVAYGYSAYQLAVKNGYEGTEEEWLASLKGEKGDPCVGEGEVLPVKMGGTGANNATTARANLGITAVMRTELGEYTGTGTKSLTLTFSFRPDLFFIIPTSIGSGAWASGVVIGTIDNGIQIVGGQSGVVAAVDCTWQGNKVTLTTRYNPTDPTYFKGYNESGTSYQYVALGE